MNEKADFVLLPGRLTDPLTFRCSTCGDDVVNADVHQHTISHGKVRFTTDLTAIRKMPEPVTAG